MGGTGSAAPADDELVAVCRQPDVGRRVASVRAGSGSEGLSVGGAQNGPEVTLNVYV